MSEQFLYRFLPGDRPELAEGPDAWTAADHEITARHIAYLEQGAADGTVIVAGRCQDWVGPAIVIIETVDEGTARTFMQADPFVAEGLFRAELHPFRIAIART